MVAEFIRFYGYTADQVLDEFAVRFFSLCNSMYQLQAHEELRRMTSSNPNEEVIEGYKKQAKGLPGILDEVRIVRP
jgi:hypothetical protein